MRSVTFAATQTSCVTDQGQNHDRIEELIREAAQRGANVILPQELFSGIYFCQTERSENFEFASTFEESEAVRRFSALARELGVVIPISYFEKANQAFFNSIAVADADGKIVGRYRKSHIPDGPGYEEKYYFAPGDTGFTPFDTSFGRLGIAVCWDQWFPEAARILTLRGAEFICYPTAIGSEPQDSSLDSAEHWRRTMQGHAAANMVPVIASNRTGVEVVDGSTVTFYGTSFIADNLGAVVAEMDRTQEGVITSTMDLDQCRSQREAFGFFRDRRTNLYGPLTTLDGGN
jgi:N-carbamoylputrescine amidase